MNSLWFVLSLALNFPMQFNLYLQGPNKTLFVGSSSSSVCYFNLLYTSYGSTDTSAPLSILNLIILSLIAISAFHEFNWLASTASITSPSSSMSSSVRTSFTYLDLQTIFQCPFFCTGYILSLGLDSSFSYVVVHHIYHNFGQHLIDKTLNTAFA